MRSLPRPVLAAAASLVLALLAGCGVATSGEPQDMGDAKVAGAGSGGEFVRPPEAADATSPEDLVDKFFKAGVGGDADAAKRVRGFLTREGQLGWQPRGDLTVVRVKVESATFLGGSGNRSRVVVSYTPVGILSSDGTIRVRHQASVRHQFEVIRQGGSYLLTGAPSGMMISDAALVTYYQVSPIYFWDLRRTVLVPDPRYLPRTMPVERRPNQVVDWLLRGPSDLLQGAVAQFRSGTSQKAPGVVQANGTFVVNLSSTAASDDPADQQRLADQLRWSIRPYVTGPLELRIEGQRKDVDGTSDSYRSRNAAAIAGAPELFTVGDKGSVVATRTSPAAGQSLLILSAMANSNVEYAAITADHRVAAFVHRRAGTLALTVVTLGVNGKLQERAIPLYGAGRPVFVPGSRDQLLVPAGGRLYLVNGAGRRDQVTLPVTGVASVSVAPDGRRVALVAGGRAYVAALGVDQSSVTVGELHELAAGLLSSAAVAWASEDRVLVAGGQGGRARLLRVSVDGVLLDDLSPKAQALTDVIAFPATPGSTSRGELVAETDSSTFFVFPSTLRQADLLRPFYAN